MGEAICCIDKMVLEKDLSSQKRPLFKFTSDDGKWREDSKNFLYSPGVITLIRNMGGKLKVWDLLNTAPKSE